MRLIKQHKGMFRNRILYEGKLKIEGSTPKIEGTYERGRVELIRRRGLKKERNVTEILSSINKTEDHHRSLISTTPSTSIMKKYVVMHVSFLISLLNRITYTTTLVTFSCLSLPIIPTMYSIRTRTDTHCFSLEY